jgi:hypothetical protein
MESGNTPKEEATHLFKEVSNKLTPVLTSIYHQNYRDEIGQLYCAADEVLKEKKSQCITIYYEDVFIYKMLTTVAIKQKYDKEAQLIFLNPINCENETLLIKDLIKKLKGTIWASNDSLDKILCSELEKCIDKGNCLFIIFENFHLYMEKTVKQSLIYELLNIIHSKSNILLLLLSERENISDLYEKRVASRMPSKQIELFYKRGVFKQLVDKLFTLDELIALSKYIETFYKAITSPASLSYVEKLETIYANGPSILSYMRNLMVDTLCCFNPPFDFSIACAEAVSSVTTNGISVKTSDFLATLPIKYQIILLYIWLNVKDKPDQKVQASKVYESMTSKTLNKSDISQQSKMGRATFYRMLNNMHLCGTITLKKEDEIESNMQIIYNGCIYELREFLKAAKLPGALEEEAKAN